MLLSMIISSVVRMVRLCVVLGVWFRVVMSRLKLVVSSVK